MAELRLEPVATKDHEKGTTRWTIPYCKSATSEASTVRQNHLHFLRSSLDLNLIVDRWMGGWIVMLNCFLCEQQILGPYPACSGAQ